MHATRQRLEGDLIWLPPWRPESCESGAARSVRCSRRSRNWRRGRCLRRSRQRSIRTGERERGRIQVKEGTVSSISCLPRCLIESDSNSGRAASIHACLCALVGGTFRSHRGAKLFLPAAKPSAQVKKSSFAFSSHYQIWECGPSNTNWILLSKILQTNCCFVILIQLALA